MFKNNRPKAAPVTSFNPVASAGKLAEAIGTAFSLLPWLTAQPFELIFHRRVGRRYAGGGVFFFALALLVGIYSLSQTRTVRSWMSVPKEQRVHVKTTAVLPGDHLFGAVMVLSMIAFLGHARANRRRFGTPEQLHSFDVGIPWIVYPPLLPRLLAKTAWGQSILRNTAAHRHEPKINWAATMVSPWLQRHHWGRIGLHHLVRLINGKPPYGPFTWTAVSVFEPVALAVIGGLLFIYSPSCRAFGIYLILVAAAMVVKCRGHQARWKAQIEQQNDQRLEADAMRKWQNGEPETDLSDVFTVPVDQAVCQPPAAAAGAPVGPPAGFESVMIFGGSAPSGDGAE